MIRIMKSTDGCKLVDDDEVLKEFSTLEAGEKYLKDLKNSIIDGFMRTERRPIIKAVLRDGMEIHESFGQIKYVVPAHNERPYVLLRCNDGTTVKYFDIRSIEY